MNYRILFILLCIPIISQADCEDSHCSRYFGDCRRMWGFGIRLAPAATTGFYCAKNAESSETHNAHVGGVSFQGGAFLEFAWRADCWSFGFLGDINGDTFDKTLRLSTDTAGIPNHVAHLKTPIHAGFDVRGGWFVIPNGLWYVLAVVEAVRNQFSLSNQTDLTNRGIASGCLDNCFTKAGFRVGTGVELQRWECAVFKFEYRYVANGECSFNYIDDSTTATWNHSINTKQQTFALMFEYVW